MQYYFKFLSPSVIVDGMPDIDLDKKAHQVHRQEAPKNHKNKKTLPHKPVTFISNIFK